MCNAWTFSDYYAGPSGLVADLSTLIPIIISFTCDRVREVDIAPSFVLRRYS